MVRMPGDVPGLISPALVTLLLMLPLPARTPVLLKAVVEKVLPVPTVTLPALLNAAVVLSSRPFRRVRLPPGRVLVAAALLARLARPLPPLVLSKADAVPSSTMVALLVTTLAPV